MSSPAQSRPKLTVDEKIALLSGEGHWHTANVPGVPQLRFSDGPHGVARGGATEILEQPGVPASIAFPTSSALASSWDRELARKQGAGIASECRRIGVNVILGPGLNIKFSEEAMRKLLASLNSLTPSPPPPPTRK